jgi:hypothetical protein
MNLNKPKCYLEKRKNFQAENLRLIKEYHTSNSKEEKKKILEELLKRNERYVQDVFYHLVYRY